MTNETDKEQIEQLKKWFKEYGLSILLAIVVGLGLGYGWRWYKSYQVTEHDKVRQQYHALLIDYKALAIAKPAEKKALTAKFVSSAKKFAQDNSSSSYADMMYLNLMKQSVVNKQYNDALTYAADVYDRKDAAKQIRQIAVIKAVRVLHQENKDAAAKKLLDNKFDTTDAFDDSIQRVRKLLSDGD